MANQNDIARELGVSQRAVSFALAGKPGVSPETRQRIMTTAKSLRYRPNAAARAMVNQQTRNIGVLVWMLGGYPIAMHESEFVSGIHDVLEPAGYTTCLVQMGDVERASDGMARVFAEQMLDGMVICCGLQTAMRERVGGLMDKIIWCDAGVHEPTNCLWRDEESAGRLAGEAVIRAGYRKAIWLSEVHPEGPSRMYTYREERKRGFCRAAAGCSVADLPLKERQTPLAETFAPFLNSEHAVVACSYGQAMVILSVATGMGLCPGKDFGLVSCDEINDWSRYWPNVARATFDRFATGRRAGEMMLARLDDPQGAMKSHIAKPTWNDGQLAMCGLGSTLGQLEGS